jgi:hypothetical protein
MRMRIALRQLGTALLSMTAVLPAIAQTAMQPAAPPVSNNAVPVPDPATVSAPATFPAAPPASIAPLLDFRDSEVKFSLPELMSLLRDRRHEGWVLAAYPDPKTGRPLIGAGFSLDLPERQHSQTDPLNQHAFLEPSSSQLWQAAGLDPARLQQVLAEFDLHLAAYHTRKRYRRRIVSLAPEITDDEASSLLRIAAIQAVENARAYCRNFDRLSGPQQMALSQLVYQMGVNLSEFGTFLSLINNDPALATVSAAAVAPSLATAPEIAAPNPEPSAPAQATAASPAVNPTVDTEHWRDVQQSLIASQWAHAYRVRATAVIAMLDPEYAIDPAGSEARIAAVLRPALRRPRGHSRSALRTASYRHHSAHSVPRKATAARARRKA